ncbi:MULTISPECIES: hypothetical protein [Meridianimarinicoccus]|nr:hypothetical protein [Phycocomes zhengii]
MHMLSGWAKVAARPGIAAKVAQARGKGKGGDRDGSKAWAE